MEAIGTIIFVVLFVLYLLFLIPAFMFTWEGSVFDGIGCYGWVCMIVGFPGALIALIAKTIKESYKKKQQKIRNIEYEKEKAIRDEQTRIQKDREEKEHRTKINELERKFSNGDLVKEVFQRISRHINEKPYKIEIKTDCITIYYENSTDNFVYASHGFPNFAFNDDGSLFAFANVLNFKLGNKYANNYNSKYHPFNHSDGTPGGWSEYIGRTLTLQSNRSFY